MTEKSSDDRAQTEDPMKKRAYPRSSGRLYERFCAEHFPEEKESILERADREYQRLLAEMPDLGGGANPMAFNMETWFCMVAFYEASGRRIGGEAFQTIHGRHIDRLRFLGRLIDANRDRWIYRLFGSFYAKYEKQLRRHREKGEWTESWDIVRNPESRSEGYAFHLTGCPIARHAKRYGYEELLPWLCRTDHVLAEVMHARLIRTQIESRGGAFRDYWYVGDKSPALDEYGELEKI